MKKISERLKNKYLKEITNNLGKVEITDDKIICYVDQKKLDKQSIVEIEYVASSEFCIKQTTHKIQLKNLSDSKLKELGIDLSVYFIFDNIQFGDLSLNCDKDNIHILFKNCTFNKSINIKAPNVTFESNEYSGVNSSEIVIGANNLKIINETYSLFVGEIIINVLESLQFINSCLADSYPSKKVKILSEKNFLSNHSRLQVAKSNLTLEGIVNIQNSWLYGNTIKVNADMLVLENNLIDLINKFDINLEKNMDIKDTHIGTAFMNVTCEKINLIDSEINSKYFIDINEKISSNDNDILESIESPKIIYNGINLSEISYINQNHLDKQKLRKILVRQLKELNEKVQNNINNQSICKVLKK